VTKENREMAKDRESDQGRGEVGPIMDYISWLFISLSTLRGWCGHEHYPACHPSPEPNSSFGGI